MEKASQEILETLHGLQAQAMIEELQRARTSGEGIQASLFAAISRFLKDNNIEANLGTGDDAELERHLSRMASLPYDGEVPDEYKQ